MVLSNGAGASSPSEDQAATAETVTKTDTLSSAINAALDGGTERAAPEGTSQGAEKTTQSTAPKADGEQATATDPAKPAGDPTKAVQEDQAQSEAPQHWPADRRQAFAALPPEARGIVNGFVKDLTGGYTRKMQEVGDEVRFAKGVRSLFNDEHRQQMQRDGVDEQAALRNLVQIHDFASKDPVSYVKWAMQRFGITPEHLTGQKTEQPGKTEPADPLAELLIDPKVKALEAQLSELAQWRQAQERQVAEATQQHQRQVEQTYQNAISGFRSAIDDTGNLKYPHFDQVGRAMGALMETHPQLARMADSPQKMELAYEMAVRADPELSQPIIESEVTRRMADARKREDAERAKRAGGIRPSSGAPTAPRGGLDLNASLDAALSQVGF